MRRITKTRPPERFEQWLARSGPEWTPSWKDLQNPEKGDLRTRLLDDQGWICCYCGQRIGDGSALIEHVVPRDTSNELELDFDNLLASCGAEARRKEPRHCGPAKDNWYDHDFFVSPLDDDCEDRFVYLNNGTVVPSPPEDPRSVTTIRHLGLYLHSLVEMRRKAIDGFIGDPATDPLTLSESDVSLLLASLDQRDESGRFEPFCQVIVQALRRLLPTQT